MNLTRTYLVSTYSDGPGDVDLEHKQHLRRHGWHDGIQVRRYERPGRNGVLIVWEADIPVWRTWLESFRWNMRMFAARHRLYWLACKLHRT